MASGSVATLQVRDYATTLKGTELSPVRLASYQIDAANLATWLTGWGTWKTALDAIILGVQQSENVVIYDTVLSNAIPVSPFAQREIKMLVSYVGNDTDRVRQFEVPCPDLAALTFSDGDNINIADGGVMAAFVAADEAVRRMPDDDAEEITITGAEIVGRNI